MPIQVCHPEEEVDPLFQERLAPVRTQSRTETSKTSWASWGGTPHGEHGAVYVRLETSHVLMEHRLGCSAHERGDAAENEGKRTAPEAHPPKHKEAFRAEVGAAEGHLFWC